MVEIVYINTDEPYWEMDLDRAIGLFKMKHHVFPRMIVGENFLNAVMSEPELVLTGNCIYYKGNPLRYVPDISYVILSDGREEKTCYDESFCEGRECGECVFM